MREGAMPGPSNAEAVCREVFGVFPNSKETLLSEAAKQPRVRYFPSAKWNRGDAVKGGDGV